jgi:hypothetical protein
VPDLSHAPDVEALGAVCIPHDDHDREADPQVITCNVPALVVDKAHAKHRC